MNSVMAITEIVRTFALCQQVMFNRFNLTVFATAENSFLLTSKLCVNLSVSLVTSCFLDLVLQPRAQGPLRPIMQTVLDGIQ